MSSDGIQSKKYFLRKTRAREARFSAQLGGGGSGGERASLVGQQPYQEVNVSDSHSHDIEGRTRRRSNGNDLRGTSGRQVKRTRVTNDHMLDQMGPDERQHHQRQKVQHVVDERDISFNLPDNGGSVMLDVEPLVRSGSHDLYSGYQELEQGSSSGSLNIQSTTVATTATVVSTGSLVEVDRVRAGRKRSAAFSSAQETKRRRSLRLAEKSEMIGQKQQQQQQEPWFGSMVITIAASGVRTTSVSSVESTPTLTLMSTSPSSPSSTSPSSPSSTSPSSPSPSAAAAASFISDEQQQQQQHQQHQQQQQHIADATEPVVETGVAVVAAISAPETTEVTEALLGLSSLEVPVVVEEPFPMEAIEGLLGLATAEPPDTLMITAAGLLMEIADPELTLFTGPTSPATASTISFTREIMDDHIPVVQYVVASEAEICPICTETIKEQEDVRILDCGHEFHDECIMPWFTSGSNTCPNCRRNII